MGTPHAVRTLRSILHPDTLLDHVRRNYATLADARECVLLRSLSNDVYRVETAERSFVLKVYGYPRRTSADVEWEVALVQHLAANAIPVAGPVQLSNGGFVGTVGAPEGPRPAVVWTLLPGDLPRPPFTQELYREYGAAVGRLHVAAAGFEPAGSRQAVDPLTMIDESLDLVLPRLAHRPDDQYLVARLAAAARPGLAGYLRNGADLGVCHGDVSLDNLHVVDEGLAIYDFDSAAPGPLPLDLAGVRMTECWPDFLAGYRTVRDYAAAEVEVTGWCAVASELENFGWHLTDFVALRGTGAYSESNVDNQILSLRRLAGQLRLDGV